MRTVTRVAPAVALVAALLVPAVAQAQLPYPEPSQPGKVAPKPHGPFKTRTVCRKKGRCDFRSLQKAINKSHKGDKIVVKRGVYHEGVKIVGAKKSYLRIIGDIKHPGRVVLDGKGLRGAAVQNGVLINGADKVTVRGIKARNYKGNGFFAVNVVGYTLRNLIAERTGVYGIYAFNSKGGLMADSKAYWANDGAFYVGQTPPQAKPIRTVVRHVDGYESVIGFSGTNMRYVTITKSRFYNNGIGIVPNALDSEKYPPEEDNVITGNEIFWNNFDFRKGAPFPQPNPTSNGALVPSGTGIVLVGGRGNRVEHNKIYGNYLGGVGLLDGILISKPQNAGAVPLKNNSVTDNEWGLGGTDTNGRDVIYDGSGSGNCFSAVGVTFPAGNPARFPACPFTGNNTYSGADRNTMLGWIGPNALKGWVRHPHPAKPGITPLEVWTKK
jgi:Right handed beta helix region